MCEKKSEYIRKLISARKIQNIFAITRKSHFRDKSQLSLYFSFSGEAGFRSFTQDASMLKTAARLNFICVIWCLTAKGNATEGSL